MIHQREIYDASIYYGEQRRIILLLYRLEPDSLGIVWTDRFRLHFAIARMGIHSLYELSISVSFSFTIKYISTTNELRYSARYIRHVIIRHGVTTFTQTWLAALL